MGRGYFEVEGMAIVKYRDTLRSFVQKWLNLSTGCLSFRLRWAQRIIQIPQWEGVIFKGEKGAHCKV